MGEASKARNSGNIGNGKVHAVFFPKHHTGLIQSEPHEFFTECCPILSENGT